MNFALIPLGDLRLWIELFVENAGAKEGPKIKAITNSLQNNPQFTEAEIKKRTQGHAWAIIFR